MKKQTTTSAVLLDNVQKSVLRQAIIDDFKESVMSQGIIVTGTLIETKGARVADRIISSTQDMLTRRQIAEKKTKKNAK